MSALPNPLHTSKKPAARAARPSKLNQYGRDPLSPSERLRASSDYDTEKGYSPFFHAFLSDLPRLSSGNSCTLLLLTLWAKSAGRGNKKGEPRPEWTLSLSLEDLAQICCCDVRTVERELAGIDKRGLAEIRRPGKGEVEARLKYRDWESLPNYKSAVVEMPTGEDDTEPLADQDESKPGNQRVTGRKPVRLPAGHISKAFPVSCGVKTFKHKAEGPIDLEFSCVIQAGELLVVSKVSDESLQKFAISNPRSNGINDNTSFPRHGCRGESEAIPTNEGRSVSPQKRVTHPRAAELVKLFDPILAKSAARLLSMDSASLLAACDAVADCDHDYLVHFSILRAERPVKSPLTIKTICAEALASWRESLKTGVLPEVKAPGKKKGFVDDVMGVFERRLKRDGKL